MDKTHVIWAFQWVFYCFIHSFLANPYVKDKVLKGLNLRAGTYRLIYNIIAFIHLLVLIFFHTRLKSTAVFPQSSLTSAVALAMIVGGVSIMAICIAKYFRQLSGAFEPSAGNALFTGGLHRFVRHPLYFGTFLFLLGALLYWPLLKNVLVVTIIIAYTLLGIQFEEKKLLGEFGESYRLYRRKVPMIIPGLRWRKKKTRRSTGSVP